MNCVNFRSGCFSFEAGGFDPDPKPTATNTENESQFKLCALATITESVISDMKRRRRMMVLPL